jgi:hypothetical protein
MDEEKDAFESAPDCHEMVVRAPLGAMDYGLIVSTFDIDNYTDSVDDTTVAEHLTERHGETYRCCRWRRGYMAWHRRTRDLERVRPTPLARCPRRAVHCVDVLCLRTATKETWNVRKEREGGLSPRPEGGKAAKNARQTTSVTASAGILVWMKDRRKGSKRRCEGMR